MEEVIEKKLALPTVLTTVTPFSKGLALALFVTLPFLGFLFGMEYQKVLNINTLEQVAANSEHVALKKSTDIIYPTIQPEPTALPSIKQRTCEDTANELFGSVSTSSTDAMCSVIIPMDFYPVGYTFEYPLDWVISTVGAAGINMGFTDSKDDLSPRHRLMFLNITYTDNPDLEYAHLATQCYECDEPSPLIEEDEVIVSKEIRQFLSNRVLHVRVRKGTLTLSRYFLVEKGAERDRSTVFMFSLDKDSDELTSQVEQLLGTFSAFE